MSVNEGSGSNSGTFLTHWNAAAYAHRREGAAVIRIAICQRGSHARYARTNGLSPPWALCPPVVELGRTLAKDTCAQRSKQHTEYFEQTERASTNLHRRHAKR